MENNFDNTPEKNGQETPQPVYTDPNADLYNHQSSEPVEDKKEEQPKQQSPYTYQQNPQPEQQPYTYQQDPQPEQQQQYTYQQAPQPEQQQYTYQQASQPEQQQYTYQQSQYTSQQDGQYQNTNYQQQYQQQYQDNYNYNVGNNAGYQQPNMNAGYDTTPLSMGDCILMIILLGIPCVNIIMACVWAFGKNGNLNRRNYCRAYLIIVGVVAVIYLIFAIIFGVALGAGSYYY